MDEVRYVWVLYPDADYDSRWHSCRLLGRPAEGLVEVELEAAAPPVRGYIGLDRLGCWPGVGAQADLRNFDWVPFPPSPGDQPEPRAEVGTRRITLPAGLVHTQRGPVASSGWHPSYNRVRARVARRQAGRVRRSWRTPVGAA
jgi:hypothetical protein